jgi:hypothetical protein
MEVPPVWNDISFRESFTSTIVHPHSHSGAQLSASSCAVSEPAGQHSHSAVHFKYLKAHLHVHSPATLSLQALMTVYVRGPALDCAGL